MQLVEEALQLRQERNGARDAAAQMAQELNEARTALASAANDLELVSRMHKTTLLRADNLETECRRLRETLQSLREQLADALRQPMVPRSATSNPGGRA